MTLLSWAPGIEIEELDLSSCEMTDEVVVSPLPTALRLQAGGLKLTLGFVRIDPTLSAARALQKQEERAEDAQALVSGAKTHEELRAERGAFAFPRVRVRLDKVESFT